MAPPGSSAAPQGMLKRPFQDGQLINMPVSPMPISNIPYSALVPNYVESPIANLTAPNHNSSPIAPMSSVPYSAPLPNQVTPPVANIAASNYNLAAPPAGNSVMDEKMVTLRAELQKMFYDNFGIETKPISRMCQKPYRNTLTAYHTPKVIKSLILLNSTG